MLTLQWVTYNKCYPMNRHQVVYAALETNGVMPITLGPYILDPTKSPCFNIRGAKPENFQICQKTRKGILPAFCYII